MCQKRQFGYRDFGGLFVVLLGVGGEVCLEGGGEVSELFEHGSGLGKRKVVGHFH